MNNIHSNLGVPQRGPNDLPDIHHEAPSESLSEAHMRSNKINAAADKLNDRVHEALTRAGKIHKAFDGVSTTEDLDRRVEEFSMGDVERANQEIGRIGKDLADAGVVLNMEMADGADVKIAFTSKEDLVEFLQKYNGKKTV